MPPAAGTLEELVANASGGELTLHEAEVLAAEEARDGRPSPQHITRLSEAAVELAHDGTWRQAVVGEQIARAAADGLPPSVEGNDARRRTTLEEQS